MSKHGQGGTPNSQPKRRKTTHEVSQFIDIEAQVDDNEDEEEDKSRHGQDDFIDHNKDEEVQASQLRKIMTQNTQQNKNTRSQKFLGNLAEKYGQEQDENDVELD